MKAYEKSPAEWRGSFLSSEREGFEPSVAS